MSKFRLSVSFTLATGLEKETTHLIRIVKVQEPRPALIDALVACISTHDKAGIHVHVVRSKVDRDESLEDDGPAGKG